MTLLANRISAFGGVVQQTWATDLTSTSSQTDGPLEVPGSIRVDVHPVWGYREFMYVQFHQSGGAARGELLSFIDPIAISNISAGTTSSITTSSLTANLYKGGILRCLDDAGGAGAAPEGEMGVIASNTTTVITLDAEYGIFSAAPAANDDFNVILPWAVEDAASGDETAQVAGVPLVDHDQYAWGWVQYRGLNPYCLIVAAGTALPTLESLIAGTALLTDGAGATIDQRVGFIKHAVTSDTVARYALVDLFCGKAFNMGTSTS